MSRTILAAALAAAVGTAPLPLLTVAAHAQGAEKAPMQDAGAAGEHTNKKGMEKKDSMMKSAPKKHGSKKM